MPQQQIWRTEAGMLLAEAGGLQLRVLRVENCARFLVIRAATQGRARPPALIASGIRDDVRAAVEAAEAMARTLEPPPPGPMQAI